ncbi:hypothetical protein EDB19DRAFT_1808982 [Suillus lakei]|nr:hypothetical protein EDB19DRAFT_1808982 [Suillus lakei]
MMTVASSPPLAIRLLSGDTATDRTRSVCPTNGPPTISPVCTSKIRRVLSCEPVTTRRPSLKNATAHTLFLRCCIARVGAGCPFKVSLAVSGTPDMSYDVCYIVVLWILCVVNSVGFLATHVLGAYVGFLVGPYHAAAAWISHRFFHHHSVHNVISNSLYVVIVIEPWGTRTLRFRSAKAQLTRSSLEYDPNCLLCKVVRSFKVIYGCHLMHEHDSLVITV